MQNLKYFMINIVETLLRFIPIPCKTGMIKIGDPGRNSPVFLTCNYHLTVARVKRSLRGMNAYLLVANSRGMNVWCASCGGHFTNHDVISILKISGIENLVEHRNVILPQLAATAIESRVIKKRTGWNVIWGPVYSRKIKDFVESDYKKSDLMKSVIFNVVERIEMASAWAFTISFIPIILFIAGWMKTLYLIYLIWIISLVIFISFPLYIGLLQFGKRKLNFFHIYFEKGWFQLFMIVISLIIFGLVCAATGKFRWIYLLKWGSVIALVIIVITIDLMGSASIFKSSLSKDLDFRITSDESKCKIVGFCTDVCPRNCFEVDKESRITALKRTERCIRCGSCIVQCPFDALYFQTSKGEKVVPDDVRRFKLNMMGKRDVVSKN